MVSFLLQGNYISGSIPTEIGLLAHLEQLVVSENQITGQLPSEIGFLKSLKRLDFGCSSSIKTFKLLEHVPQYLFSSYNRLRVSWTPNF
ncbi:expressed unknown protein [Seminavis robusta]|uniref:Uncharacterized protein n=1 Tax=Seminavis robusta TaxID=568900 RepID=A0A9N8EB54_9STRA|nr:expressed unknown protein [Seminavis robusta]|eukprot:Sro911_g219260.1 n/a (89) ;mRNA; f:26095-26599